ncbi:MAG: hypothetical protein MI923_08740 [Phycisphaerales bacterium]|nr:hypothetical protein [Phycisphaerales bacterium]
MIWHRFTVYGTAALVTLLAGTGCLERKEKIEVRPDGSVTVKLKYKGTADELDSMDAMPSADAGWLLTRTIEENQGNNEQNEVKYVVRSKRKFASGDELPSSYAEADDPDADLYLAFPTTVVADRREDGTYYHFRRVYMPRKWAYVSYWENRFFNEEIEELGGKPTEELTREEQVKIFKAFVLFEAHSQMEFAKAALGECDPELPSDCWLKTRSALMERFNRINYHKLVERYAETPEEERPARFESEYEALIAEAREITFQSLRDVAGYNDAKLAEFELAYDREKHYHEITDEQGAHQFKIMVNLPGEIVAHNADRLDQGEDGYLVWEFNGEAFRDRPFELEAISRLKPGSEQK